MVGRGMADHLTRSGLAENFARQIRGEEERARLKRDQEIVSARRRLLMDAVTEYRGIPEWMKYPEDAHWYTEDFWFPMYWFTVKT